MNDPRRLPSDVDAALRAAPGQLRGAVRPAAQPDREAQARHHRGGALHGHRRVHRPHQARRRRRPGTSGTSSRPRRSCVVASTLLDLKAARLLPQGDVEDEEDLALLEARDLLFARLLQYRAFKQVAAVLEKRIGERGTAPPARGRPRRAVRQPAARRADRARARGVRGARGTGAGAEAGPRALARPHPRADRQRARAGGDRGRAAAPAGHADLPGPRRRRPRHADPGGPLPVAARAVPRGRGGLRADDAHSAS